MYHKAVLLKESIEGLEINSDGTYVDITFGGGEHSKEILKKLNNGRLIAFDQDKDALQNLIDDKRFTFVEQNFIFLKNFLKLNNAIPVDGILADLGVSSHQIDTSERGFSIRFNAELDTRMDKSKDLTAKEIINNYSEEQLKDIFYSYGEINNGARLANTIVEKRKIENIKTIKQFKEAISSCVPNDKENKYLAKVFQALRIEVNDELNVLKEMLNQTVDVMKKGGRLVVISYHSLEDRLVKNFLKSGNFDGIIEKDFYGNPKVPYKLINRKVIVPNEKEIMNNSRSRSAKLRIAEKI